MRSAENIQSDIRSIWIPPLRWLDTRLPVMVFCYCILLLSCSLASDSGAVLQISPRQDEIRRQLLTLRPTGNLEPSWMLARWDPHAGLERIIPMPTGSGNAASYFARIEDVFPGEETLLAGDNAGTAAGVGYLLDAAETAFCRLAPEYYPVFDHTTARQPDFIVLRKYLQALLMRAENLARLGNTAAAERCYRAAMICGKHLADDRSTTLVYMTGLIFTLRGAQAYQAYLRQGGRVEEADKVQAYLFRLEEIIRLFHWKANVALGDNADFACLAAAIIVATQDKEPCWRREAVARLAIMRHGIPDSADGSIIRHPRYEQAAEQTLSAVAANDPEPSIRRLAIWAAFSIRPDKYETLRPVFLE